MTIFVNTKDGLKHEFSDLPFSLSIDHRTDEIMFEDGLCRFCGRHSNEHRILRPSELTPEWQICGTEKVHSEFTLTVALPEHHICIRREDCGEYMSREEFEELYDE